MNDELKQGSEIQAGEDAGVVAVLKMGSGTIVAVSSDGSIRELQIGDAIYEGELVESAGSGFALLTLADGSVHQLPPGEGVRASAEALAALPQQEGDEGLFEELLAALEAGEDITEKLDKTAAGEGDGGGASDESGQGALFARSVTEVKPEAGFDPDLPPRPQVDPTADTTPLSEPEIIINGLPSAGESSVQLDDDALKGGNPGGTGDVDPDTANTAGTLVHEFGLDGAGTLGWLTTGAPAGFTYELSGDDLLVKQGGVTVITVTLDPSSGDYTVTQNAAIDHPEGGDENDLSFNLNYSVTDSNGDSAQGSLSIDVDDDTPEFIVEEYGQESDLQFFGEPTLTVDETELSTDASASFAGAFGSVFYGADGPADTDPLVYALSISADAVDSGIVDTLSGEKVFLYMNGDAVEGRTETGGDVVFTVSVDEFGEVTLDQIRAVVHDNVLDHDESSEPTTLVSDDLITLTATATDGDGDPVSEAINIGSNLAFEDDGPTAVDDGPESVTEDVGSGVVSGDVLSNDDANADQSEVFVSWGADQANLDAIAALNTYGALVQNGDGTWSYTLDNSLATTQALTAADSTDYELTYIMADADGDQASATLTITINGANDEATVETVAATGPDGTVYEAGLNPDGSDAGADSEKESGTFTVSASDGILTVVIGGTTYTLAEVQAFNGSDTVNTGEGVLTLDGYTGDSFGGTINYTYELSATIDNDSKVVSGDDAVTLAHFDDSVEITVNGVGGTSASDDLVIRAIDDTPTLTSIDNIEVPNAATSVIGNINGLEFGADGPNTGAGTDDGLAITNWTDLDGITETLSDDGNTLTATIDSSGEVYYTLTLNNDGTYTFDLVTPEPTQIIEIGEQFVGGSPVETIQVNADGNEIIFDGLSYDSSTQTLSNPNDGSDNLNPNNIGFGLQNGNINDNQAFQASSTVPIDGIGFTVVGQGNIDSTTIYWETFDANGSVDSGILVVSGLNAAGNDGVAINIGSGGEFESIQVRFDHDDSNDSVRIQDFTVTDEIVPEDTSLEFEITATDGDGDTASASFSVDVVNVNEVVVGSNANDVDGQTEDHTVPKDNITVEGAITGNVANDVLIGDTGGGNATGVSANLIFVLDTSGSMSEQIDFGAGTISRLQAMKNALIDSLNSLVASDADNIRVYIAGFSTDGSAIGTYNLTVGGVDNNAELAQAIADINALTDEGWTNYEAGLVKAQDWIDGGSALAGADVNKVVFVSDGKPNYVLDDNGNPRSATSVQAINEIANEVADIEASGFTIEAVGINVDNAALNLLSEVEGPGGSATNVDSAEELSDVIGELGTIVNLDAIGSDLITAGGGNDIIFGDAPYTDALKSALDVQLSDGSGWEVFAELEASADWSRDDTLSYILNNHETVGRESLDSAGQSRVGGNDIIDAGAGDDIVYGQEGDDTITGGQGSDLLSGGSGRDTFVWLADDATGSPVDTISDFNVAEGDVLDLSTLLTGESNNSGSLDSYLDFSLVDGNTEITVDTNGAVAGGDTQTIVLEGVDLTNGGVLSNVQVIDNLLAGNSLVTDGV
ncbi:MAG: retention module-containing protein [Porticoccaceae bacterium]|nr:retention module-containing protein [Porticoccaceae bacterium]